VAEGNNVVRRSRTSLKEALDRKGLRWLRLTLMVLSVVLAGRKASPDAEVRAALDRTGLRWMLAWLLERSLAMQARGIDKVLYTSGAWFHRFHEVYVHVETPGASLPTPTQLDEQTRDTWEHHYTPKPGDVVIDAGAGTGTEVLRWSRLVGETGRVLAIEANPRTFSVLSRFCELNNLTNVELHSVALSDTSGTIEIEVAADHLAASTVTGAGTVTVIGITVDELLARSAVAEVGFLKMNIEGAEVPALRGMTAAADKIRNLCISCHDFRADRGHGEVFRTKAVVIRELERIGLRVEPQSDDTRPWIRDQVNARRLNL
jgi:FkbM family methyltransferase